MTINAIVNTLCGTTDTRRTYSCVFCGLCVLVVFSGVCVYLLCSQGSVCTSRVLWGSYMCALLCCLEILCICCVLWGSCIPVVFSGVCVYLLCSLGFVCTHVLVYLLCSLGFVCTYCISLHGTHVSLGLVCNWCVLCGSCVFFFVL